MGQIGRRHFLIAAGTMLAARLARAQTVQKVYQIGVLQSASSDVGGLSESFSLLGIQLAGHGYVRQFGISSPVKPGPSRRFSWVPKTAQASDAELSALAAELVTLKVDVILAVGAKAAMAAKRSTATMPVVMLIQGDPVQLGLVESLGRPGSNVTGVTTVASELAVKRLELLKEAVPGLTRVAVIWNPIDVEQTDQWRAIGVAAQKLSIELRSIEAGSADDLPRILDALRESDAGALLVFSDRLTRNNAAAIAGAAESRRLPAAYTERAFVSYLNGGLMSYGPVHVDLLERTAKLMAQVLDGAKPSELPVEQPSSFELVVNARSAKAIGLNIPPSILLRANQVLE
jgi:putative ABC transport system substrate-binding protein